MLDRLTLIAALVALVAACAEDPQYIDPRMALEANAPGSDPDAPDPSLVVQLPIELETERDLMKRTELANELGVEVPYVRLGDLDVSIEWTITNLEDAEGTARIHVNGGNEYFRYVPLEFVIDPEEDEEPPPLLGDIPLTIPASGRLSGVFREDQLREASIDLELITRGATNPFAAILQIHEDTELIDDGMGTMIPLEAFALLIQYEVSFQANRHMVLEINIRVRDRRGIVHELLTDADPAELTAFMPADFVPPPPPAP